MDLERPKMQVRKHPTNDSWFIEFMSKRSDVLPGMDDFDRLGFWASEAEMRATILTMMAALDKDIMSKLFEIFMSEGI